MTERTTLVLGASATPSRYAHMAAQQLLNRNENVYLLGKAGGEIQGHAIVKDWPEQEIHTVTMYLNPRHQEAYYDQILATKPNRVIFNPGAENPELAQKLTEANISYENACTLVLLSTNQY